MGTGADLDSLENKYAVSIERALLSYVITATVHGNPVEIAKAPISSSPAEIDLQLEKLQQSKIDNLEKLYAVRIGKTGSAVSETAYGQMHLTAHCVPVRSPKLGELCVLEYALEHSKPSQLTNISSRSKGINIYFLNKKQPFSVSEWGYDGSGKPSIFIEAKKGISFGHTLEEHLMHQLSHNSEYRMGWNPYESWKWPMAAKLGWVFSGDPHSTELTINGHTRTLQRQDEFAWLIKSSEGPNFLYKPLDDESWVRCNSALVPLDENGQAVAESKAKKLSSEKVRQYALIRPLSLENPTPPEVLADALALFRADRESRAELLHISPPLYKLTREHDQNELDKTYGKGKMVRSVDGTISEPTFDVIKEIQELEEGKAS